MKNPFTEHPNSIGQSYVVHLLNASRYAVVLLISGLCCLIHAIFPFVFVSTASTNVLKLADEFNEIKAKCEAESKNTE